MRHRLRAHVLEQAEIVCATLAGAGQEALYGHTFETVVIDEAVQAAELSALIPLRYECTRCILVGDPKQLPPTVLSQDAERRGYAQSLFVRLYNQAQSHVHLLSIQYRMHPNISLFPSAAFYGGRLLDGPDVAVHTRQPWHGTALFGPFRFFHVAALEETARGHSIQNRREAAVALDVYDALRTCAGSALAGRVGFVSMYKGQVDLLRSTFVARHGRDALPGVDFSSVDGFQGQEKDVIIISCVRSNRHGAIGFLSDQRRLNVALTRARCNMIVIGNGDMLQGASTVWRRLVQEAQVRGFYVKVGANTFEDPRRPAPRAEVARALPAPTWPPAAGPPHPQPARPPQARPAAPRATPSKPTPRTPPTEPAPAAPSGHTSTLPRKRSAPEPPSARQPPHVVPSSSLLQPKKPGKWASIVERNRARPTEPPKVAAAANGHFVVETFFSSLGPPPPLLARARRRARRCVATPCIARRRNDRGAIGWERHKVVRATPPATRRAGGRRRSRHACGASRRMPCARSKCVHAIGTRIHTLQRAQNTSSWPAGHLGDALGHALEKRHHGPRALASALRAHAPRPRHCSAAVRRRPAPPERPPARARAARRAAHQAGAHTTPPAA